MRLSPMRISCSTIESSSSSGPFERSVMRARAPSKPRPASTETVRRSSTSGSCTSMFVRRVRTRRPSTKSGSRKASAAPTRPKIRPLPTGSRPELASETPRITEPTMPAPLMARNDVGVRRWPRPAEISRRRISSGFCVIGSAVARSASLRAAGASRRFVTSRVSSVSRSDGAAVAAGAGERAGDLLLAHGDRIEAHVDRDGEEHDCESEKHQGLST